MPFILLFLCLLLFPNIANATTLPVDITAETAIVVDLDEDEVIYTKNPDQEVVLASLTKIMTAYTVLENVDNLNKKVTITEDDLYNLYGFLTAGLEEGDKVTYLDLLYAMMLPSGADASQALALHTSGSIEAFNELMNEEARKLGLRRSHFADSFGRDDNNISTARDLSRLLKTALENPTFKKVFTTDYYTLSNGLRVINYTDSIATFHGFDTSYMTGSKSGFTEVANLLLASTVKVNGKNYIIIVCKSDLNQWNSTHVLDTYKIIDYLKEQDFKKRTIIKKGTILKKIPVEGGTIDSYYVISDQEISATLTDDEYAKVTYVTHLSNKLTINSKKGEYLGFIDILVDDEIIDTHHIYLKEDIFSYQTESKIVILVIVLLVFIIIVLLSTNFIFRKR